MNGTGSKTTGITPHHSFLLYIQVSSFSEGEMISSGLPQSFKNSALVDPFGDASLDWGVFQKML
jgi:hypothetical protein